MKSRITMILEWLGTLVDKIYQIVRLIVIIAIGLIILWALFLLQWFQLHPYD